jgi:hypothetical protein
MRQPLDEARFQLARATIEENHRVARVPPRSIANTVLRWADQGHKTDPREARTKAALAVDRAALESWTKAALAGKATIAVIGNVKKLDQAKLRKLGPVTTVPVAKLFGY